MKKKKIINHSFNVSLHIFHENRISVNISSLDNRLFLFIYFDEIEKLINDFKNREGNYIKKLSKNEIILLKSAQAQYMYCIFDDYDRDTDIDYMIVLDNRHPVYICKRHLSILIKILESILSDLLVKGSVSVEEITFEEVK